MFDYIWLDDKSPILKQLPSNFKSAAILLHPFVQMSFEWKPIMQQDLYPSNGELLKYGIPVTWEKVMHDSGINTTKELALALKTSIGALRNKFSRQDLTDKLNSNLRTNLYYPTEDSTSVFLISSLLDVLGSKGSSKLYFSDPIFDKRGWIKINDVTPLEICDLTDKELILTDENMDFAFMSIYDSFTTLFITKDENINAIVQLANWEAVICDKDTYINWYLA